MKGKNKFTPQEASLIRSLLREKLPLDKEDQKKVRDKLRAIPFYITDFPPVGHPFAPNDFDDLVKSGKVSITDK